MPGLVLFVLKVATVVERIRAARQKTPVFTSLLGVAAGPSPSETAARIGVDLARDELSAELASADSDDVKSLGFLAVDLAAIALIVSVRHDLDRYWYWVAVGLGLSATLLLVALWPRLYTTGPDPMAFYEDDTAEARDAQHVAVLAIAGLSAARQHNESVRRHKGRWYTAGLVTSIVTVVGGGSFLVSVH
jgi:hypothetical protein